MGSVGCAPPAVSETRRRRASKNLCLSVGTTPPSTFVYGILCCENALFVSTEVTQSYLWWWEARGECCGGAWDARGPRRVPSYAHVICSS